MCINRVHFLIEGSKSDAWPVAVSAGSGGVARTKDNK